MHYAQSQEEGWFSPSLIIIYRWAQYAKYKIGELVEQGSGKVKREYGNDVRKDIRLKLKLD